MNNFVSVFEELSKLYEEAEVDVPETEEAEQEAPDPGEEKKSALAEAVDDEDIVIDDEPVEETETEEPTEDVVNTLVLECAKCGCIVCKEEPEVTIDEDTDLADVDVACEQCEETAGYKILGVLAPYGAAEAAEAAEAVEENLEADELSDPSFQGALVEATLTEGKILDNIKKVATRVGADAATIVRCFAELGDIITKKDTKFYEFAEYIENKAVLKALMSGNEKVMNSLTKDDIEELKADIAEYEQAKKDGKVAADD